MLCAFDLGRRENIRLGLLAKPGQVANAALARRLVELRQRLHVELVIEHLHPLRADAGDAQELGDRRRHRPAQPVERGRMPGCCDLADLAREVRADPGQPGERLALGQCAGNVELQIADEARRVAIGAHAKRVRVADLEQIGHLFEQPRDVGVVDGHCGSPPRDTSLP